MLHASKISALYLNISYSLRFPTFATFAHYTICHKYITICLIYMTAWK